MNFQISPDLFEFAANLRRVVENDTPVKQGLMFALGRRYGLTVKTLAGMGKRSESHVRRMLRLLELPNEDVIAISAGASYSPRLSRARSAPLLPKLPVRAVAPISSQAGQLGCSGFLSRSMRSWLNKPIP